MKQIKEEDMKQFKIFIKGMFRGIRIERYIDKMRDKQFWDDNKRLEDIK